MKRKVLASLPVFAFFLCWELSSRFFEKRTGGLFPPPSVVAYETIRLSFEGILADHFWRTFLRVIIGFLSGAFLGVLLGIAMGWKGLAERTLHPLISLLYPIPALGWIPLLMIWVGIGELLPILVIAIHSFFPVCYSTMTGIRNVDRRLIKVARTLGYSSRRTLFSVAIPSSLPYILSGLRLSSGGAWRVVIAAEMIAIPKGLGALLMKAESLIRVDIILACLFVLSLMSFLFERVFLWIERAFQNSP